MSEEQKPAPKEKKEGPSRLPSAKKRDLQSEKRRLNNRSFEAKVKTAVRSFEEAVSQGDKAVMLQRLNSVYSLLDKGVKTSKFKLNKASRTKSRLAQRVAV